MWSRRLTRCSHPFPGGHSGVVPPDPIPNSEVKRACADGSVALPCKSRSPPGALSQKPPPETVGVFSWPALPAPIDRSLAATDLCHATHPRRPSHPDRPSSWRCLRNGDRHERGWQAPTRRRQVLYLPNLHQKRWRFFFEVFLQGRVEAMHPMAYCTCRRMIHEMKHNVHSACPWGSPEHHAILVNCMVHKYIMALFP